MPGVNMGEEPLKLTWCFSPPGREKAFGRKVESGIDVPPRPSQG